jgi:predicted nuclease of predicted toxin-antitoxin system
MSLDLYMDVQVQLAITRGLEKRGVDVLRAQDDGSARLDDPELLDRAMALGRTMFSRDDDFLAEATRRQRAGEPFAGVVYAHQNNVTIGQCIEDLELIAKVYEPPEIADRVIYLPLH